MTVGETRVNVRIEKYIDNGSVEYGAPVRFRPVYKDESKDVWRFDDARNLITVIAPISPNGFDSAQISISNGEYEVSTVLPSGEIISETFSVDFDGINPASQAIDIVLRGENSPNEWRSWAHVGGSPLASHRQERIEARNLKRFSFVGEKQTTFDISVGGYLRTVTGVFDPSSWKGWFDFFEHRFEAGPEASPKIELFGNMSGLEVLTEGGYDFTPLRILFAERRSPEMSLSPTSIGKRRTFTAITGPSGTRIVALPWPWEKTAYSDSTIPFEMLAFDDDAQLRCDPVLRDARWAGLVAYLNSGRVDLAQEILASARDALFEKFENPLAAALGGYILLSSKEKESDAPWPHWLDNLATRFTHLPDGLILRARWLLSQNLDDHHQEAHDLLFEAVERGIPYFTTGVVWLIEGLEQTAIGCPLCTDLFQRVRGVARWMDLSQAFTSFSIAKPQAREAIYRDPELEAPSSEVLATPRTMGAATIAEEERVTRSSPSSLKSQAEPKSIFRLEMLPACEGDCLILSWGNADNPRRLLIDAGRDSTASAVQAYADQHGRPDGMFELFIVTHIDRDHIEGAVKLLRDETFRPVVTQIWFNDRGDLEYAPPSSEFESYGALDGERLTALIAEHQIPSNRQFHPRPVALEGEKLPTIELTGGLTLTVLSPDQDQLANLAKPWDETLLTARPGWEEFGESEPIDIDFLANRPFKSDKAKPNGSSIAVIASYQDRSVLLTGDAHVGRLLSSLEIFKRDRPDFKGFDLVKASHHGSRGNVSKDLVESVGCSRWAISTNGSQFKHPDREAIARIIAKSPGPVSLFFNYDTKFTAYWRNPTIQPYEFATTYGVDGHLAIDIV